MGKALVVRGVGVDLELAPQAQAVGVVGEELVVDAEYVNGHLEALVDNEDLSRFIL